MQVDGLAVTPGGQHVFVVGNYSESLSGFVDSRPFLAKYSALTGAFLKGHEFDTDGTRIESGVAVDPTGQHVYVGDERNPFVGRTTARVYEFDVSDLREVRRFRLASAAYRGTLHTISAAGSTATMTFAGQSLAVIAPLGPAYGSIRICLDPGVSTAGCTTPALHSTTAVERDIVYVGGPLAAGSHTIQVTNPSGSPIALDGFVVLG